MFSSLLKAIYGEERLEKYFLQMHVFMALYQSHRKFDVTFFPPLVCFRRSNSIICLISYRHFIALCIVKGDISASTICQIWHFLSFAM